MNEATRLWLGFWRAAQRYHRFEAHGLHHLDGLGPALLVAYHGKPIAYDQCMLSVSLYDRLGYMPHGVIHQAVDEIPPLRWLKDGLGFVTRDGPDLDAAIARGELLAVQPGGTREGCRSSRHRYQVSWGPRTGYLRLAARHGLPIVPVASRGVDDGYLGLNDGYRLGKAVGMPAGLPLWFGVGLGGLWPFAPAFPVRITTHLGAPLHLDLSTPDAIQVAHRTVQQAVQSLLDEVNA